LAQDGGGGVTAGHGSTHERQRPGRVKGALVRREACRETTLPLALDLALALIRSLVDVDGRPER
jgi:hypothetical protein